MYVLFPGPPCIASFFTSSLICCVDFANYKNNLAEADVVARALFITATADFLPDNGGKKYKWECWIGLDMADFAMESENYFLRLVSTSVNAVYKRQCVKLREE